MAPPFTKYALDFLEDDPDAIRLVKDFLWAIINHPEIHENRFTAEPEWEGRSGRRVGTTYFLAKKRGATAIENPRTLRSDITGPLHTRGFIEPDRSAGSARNWQKFTPAAIEWYETYGGPSDDAVRRAIGRSIVDAPPGGLPVSRLNEIAEQLGVTRSRIDELIQDLKQLHVVSQFADEGVLQLTTLAGTIWKVRGFGPVSELPPEVLRPPTEVPLDAVPGLVRPSAALQVPSGRTRPSDVFISYAWEDQEAVGRPLFKALTAAGLDVWYDESQVQIGASLRREIDAGIASSRFAVVVISEAYLNKGWTQHELDGIVTRSVSGDQVILPIWHNISKSQVQAYSPSLADKVARKTSDRTTEEIAAEIVAVIRNAA